MPLLRKFRVLILLNCFVISEAYGFGWARSDNLDLSQYEIPQESRSEEIPQKRVGGRQEGSRTWAGSSNSLQAVNIDKHTLGQAGVRGMSSSLSPLSLSFSESTTGQFRGMSSSVTHHSSPSLSLNQKHHPNLYPDPIFVDRLSWWSLPWCRALAEMENRFASLVTGPNQS